VGGLVSDVDKTNVKVSDVKDLIVNSDDNTAINLGAIFQLRLPILRNLDFLRVYRHATISCRDSPRLPTPSSTTSPALR
jgi:hypothetical protein